MSSYIVADIGGTNARFASVEHLLDHPYKLEHIQILPTADHASFEDALKTYLRNTGQSPKAVCAAIAGPVNGTSVKMTNLSWEFTCQDMADTFGVKDFIVMNDFAAVAAACSRLSDADLLNLKQGNIDPTAPKAVFGPGTGLGVAGLTRYQDRWMPMPTEGGHVNVAPTNDFEADIIKAAMQQHGHVSAEVFLSGPGLVNLYKAICAVKGITAESVTPADITSGAQADKSSLFGETLSTFCSMLGAFAGNLALTYGAKGGVYIAGGVLPRVVDFVKQSAFIEKFSDKGIMSHYLTDIPVNLITHPETAFVGAAAHLEQHLASQN